MRRASRAAWAAAGWHTMMLPQLLLAWLATVLAAEAAATTLTPETFESFVLDAVGAGKVAFVRWLHTGDCSHLVRRPTSSAATKPSRAHGLHASMRAAVVYVAV